jgi:multicomponent Na+:H+ antiporter subunit D
MTLYSMTKIWDQVFWKPAPEKAEKQDPVLNNPSVWMLAPVAMLVLLTVAIGLGAEPVYRLAVKSAEFLLQPALYVQAVLGKGAL